MTDWVEVNWHTGERRLHTAASLNARLRALHVDPAPLLDRNQPVTDAGGHSYFRVRRAEDRRIPRARPDGAWGSVESVETGLEGLWNRREDKWKITA